MLPVLLLGLALAWAPSARSSIAPPAPLTAPTIVDCRFVPDPRTEASVACGNPGIAFANVSIFFQVNVSDATDNDMIVTFYFDYYGTGGVVNPFSPTQTVTVSSPGGGAPVSANATWTYETPNANFTSGQYFVRAEVRNDLGEFNTTSGFETFPVGVTYNNAPWMDGLLSLNSVSQSIRPSNPIIPLVYENVTVGDPDNDALTLTWDWGDGTWTVDSERGPYPLSLSVTHQYVASSLPLNESPRNVDVPVHVWVDDGVGHNVSADSVTEFYIDFDSPPSVRIDRPAVGSSWKVGEAVTMAGTVTDPEGDPTSAYWDFDNRTDSTDIGDPERNQDAAGTTASHAYPTPGTYNISFWATDGDKLFCLNQTTCADFTTHWRRAIVPIVVRNNQPPVLGLSNATTVAGEPVLLRASVYDPDGDNMSVRWIFGDGSPDVVNYTGNSSRISPAVFEVFQEHVYSDAGLWNCTLSVSDGDATVDVTRTVFVQSFNLPPVILNVVLRHENMTVSTNHTFLLGERITVTVFVYDPENNTMNLSIAWADGATDRGTIDPGAAENCTTDNRSRNVCSIAFAHAYAEIGGNEYRNYTVVLTLTDGQAYFRQNASGGPPITLNHTKEWSVLLFISDTRTQGLGPWDWWDYSMLAVVLGIPSFLIGRFMWKVRHEREEA